MSNINYDAIDALYPIAGRDNDSQGFRDNFSYIKTGLAVAASEIADIQSKALLKAPLLYSATTSPLNTEWNSDGWGSMQSLRLRRFTTFYKATDELLVSSILNKEYVMRDTINDQFYRFNFTVWGGQAEGSPVTYTRTRVDPNTGRDIMIARSVGEFTLTEFDSNGAYQSGIYIEFGGKIYQIISDTVAGNTPTTAPSKFLEMKFASRFDETVTYSANTIVIYNDAFYISLVETTGNLPTNTSYFSVYAGQDVYYSDEVKFVKSADLVFPEFDPSINETIPNTTAYEDGDIVSFNNRLYSILKESTSQVNTFKYTLVPYELSDDIGFGVRLTRRDTLINTAAESVEVNDFQFNTLSNVIKSNFYGTSWIPAGTQTTSVIIDVVAEGKEYFRYVVDNGFFTIDFINWPEDASGKGLYAKLRVEFVSNGTIRTVDFASSGNKYTSGLGENPYITTPATPGDSIIIDVWSYDKGKNVYFAKVGDFKFTP
jgi:hypothetical protein